MQLRPYQIEALDAIVQNLKEGVRHQLVVMATGLGKTIIFSNLPAWLKQVHPGKMLVVAHREELLDQAIEKIRLYNPTLKVGLEKAEHHADPDCDIIVACNASIGKKGSTRMDHFWDDISVIVVDECHHVIGDSYLNILEDSGVLKPESNKLLIGFTATPKRHNRIKNRKIATLDDSETLFSLGSIFKKIVYTYTIRKAVKDGYLVQPRGFRVTTDTDLSGVKTSAGDFQIDQLAKKVNTEERNKLAVKAWLDKAEKRPTLCFTVDIQHAKDLAEVFRQNNIKASAVWGEDEYRTEKVQRFQEGKYDVLCNCALLTEGFDAPHVSCIMLARPTQSSTLYTQMIGRGTRLYPKKEDLLVFDLVDTSKKCSLVTLPSLLGINPDFDLRGQGVVAASEELAALRDKYPNIDFTYLNDLSKVKEYVEAIDIFQEPYDEDTKQHSHFAWMPEQNGSYMISVPEDHPNMREKVYAYRHEKMYLKPNELDQWEVWHSRDDVPKLKDGEKLITCDNLEEAFKVADDILKRCRADRTTLMQRTGKWHEYLATDSQRRYLRKLSKRRPVVYCLCDKQYGTEGRCPSCNGVLGLTQGQASLAINRMQHHK